MSGTKDMWIGEYESIADQYHEDRFRIGPIRARENAQAKLQTLGFDPHEIEEQLSALEE